MEEVFTPEYLRRLRKWSHNQLAQRYTVPRHLVDDIIQESILILWQKQAPTEIHQVLLRRILFWRAVAHAQKGIRQRENYPTISLDSPPVEDIDLHDMIADRRTLTEAQIIDRMHLQEVMAYVLENDKYKVLLDAADAPGAFPMPEGVNPSNKRMRIKNIRDKVCEEFRGTFFLQEMNDAVDPCRH